MAISEYMIAYLSKLIFAFIKRIKEKRTSIEEPETIG